MFKHPVKLTDSQRTIARLALKVAELEEKLKCPANVRFKPPRLADVQAYCKERGNRVDAELFIDHYTSNGWMVGKVKMRDWKAAVRTWEKSEYRTDYQQAQSEADRLREWRRKQREQQRQQFAADNARAIRPRLKKA